MSMRVWGRLAAFLRAVDLHPGGQVPLIGGLYVVIGDLHLVQVGEKVVWRQ